MWLVVSTYCEAITPVYAPHRKMTPGLYIQQVRQAMLAFRQAQSLNEIGETFVHLSLCLVVMFQSVFGLRSCASGSHEGTMSWQLPITGTIKSWGTYEVNGKKRKADHDFFTVLMSWGMGMRARCGR